MGIVDLYTSKYEGESETFLRERNYNGLLISELHLFSGDFSSIMDWIPFGPTTPIDSVAYNFNVNISWGMVESELVGLEDFYNDLLTVSSNIPSDDVNAYNAILDISKSTIQNGNKLYFKG